MAPLAHRIAVPLRRDSVLSPQLVYEHISPRGAGEGRPADHLRFVLDGYENGYGRVTFEDLDSIRACQGEYRPYEIAEPYERGEWVYEISDSPWLRERHDYEFRHYRYPLLGSYHHYLFVFHDEFVEAIAEGIWFDVPEADEPPGLRHDHPLARLDWIPATRHGKSSGIDWEWRRSPKPDEELLEDSKLCSQRLQQFNLVLDGRSREAFSAWLRTVDGRTTSRMKSMTVDGLAGAEDFLEAWERYVAEVAERRRRMGKS